MGKIYELNKMKNMKLERLPGDQIIVHIHIDGGKKVKLRLSGKSAAAWAAKLINIQGESLGHHTHPNVDYSQFMKKKPVAQTIERNSPHPLARNVEEDALLCGDFPSIIDSAKFDVTERARGGKVQEDFSEMIHTIMTTSSHTSSNRRFIRQQVDELIRKHMQEEEKRKEVELFSAAKKNVESNDSLM
ncbi:unnamed protein product [Strongylus vulgaris]|uniref:PH-15 domain-containing protein n=1 Tax=Strongylus vulgaris TaxID=40348 RepID=A0A3P7IM03_STRVU|nr:unnamed protein product [Strongylus vulgaris]